MEDLICRQVERIAKSIRQTLVMATELLNDVKEHDWTSGKSADVQFLVVEANGYLESLSEKWQNLGQWTRMSKDAHLCMELSPLAVEMSRVTRRLEMFIQTFSPESD